MPAIVIACTIATCIKLIWKQWHWRSSSAVQRSLYFLSIKLLTSWSCYQCKSNSNSRSMDKTREIATTFTSCVFSHLKHCNFLSLYVSRQTIISILLAFDDSKSDYVEHHEPFKFCYKIQGQCSQNFHSFILFAPWDFFPKFTKTCSGTIQQLVVPLRYQKNGCSSQVVLLNSTT